jgi:hypothetical protein
LKDTCALALISAPASATPKTTIVRFIAIMPPF